MGAYLNDAGGIEAGRAYVYSGQYGDTIYTFTGEAAYDWFGYSVSGAGDVDDDGYADFIVGAGRNDAGGSNAGRAYVYSGRYGNLLYTFTGEAASDYFGNSVSGAGDVDGDGYADLIVGARYNDAGGNDAGRAYVYSGQTGGLIYTFNGEAAGDLFGYRVSGAGDLDGDGNVELMVGAKYNDAGGTDAGRAYVFSCSSFVCGDANADADPTVSDVVYLINYLFKGGPAPQCIPFKSCADANGDGDVSVSDVVYLINYLFKGGQPPVC